MNKQSIILTTTTLLLSGAIASAQTPARDLPDAANPNAAGPAPTGTPDRPPAASLPDASAPDPTITGQAPASSEKMQPEMDSVGGGKTAPGAEKNNMRNRSGLVDPRVRLPYTGETASPVLSQARGPYAPIVPTAGEPTTRAVYI
jgi:hypothetical protein